MSAISHTFFFFSEGARRLGHARPEYVLAALALYVASLFIVGARWRGFIRAVGGDVGLMRAAMATLGGITAGNLTPSIRLGGEACRIALARMSGRATWQQITAATVWDRLSEVPPVAVLMIVAIVGPGHHMERLARLSHFVSSRLSGAGPWLVLLITVAAISIVAIGVAWGAAGRAREALLQLRERLGSAHMTKSVIATGIGWSVLLWLQDVLRFTCATRALGVSLSPPALATLAVVAMLGGLAPALGGMGPVEGGLVGTLLAFGVDLPTAAAITAVERAVSFVFATAAGAVVILLSGGGFAWRVGRSEEPAQI